MTMTASDTRPMRLFRAEVAGVTELTPSFRRFTFTGADLDEYGDPGYDQRIKVVFPRPGIPLDAMPTGDDWYAQWREQHPDERHPFRTYTTRAVRNDVHEIDIDMVAHEVSGPASAWIRDARVGDEVLIAAPTIHHNGANLGLDFVPPASTEQFLLVGDEPPPPPRSPSSSSSCRRQREASWCSKFRRPPIAHTFPITPGSACTSVPAKGPSATITSSARSRSTQRRCVPTAAAPTSRRSTSTPGMLWEVPRSAKGGAALKSAPLYAWIAGESSAIKQLRRHLVRDVGVDRRAVAFMGYWRLGRAEGE